MKIKKFFLNIVLKIWHSFLAVWNWFRDRKESSVQILHLSKNFIIANKSYDVVMNSDDPSVKVSLQLQLRKLHPELINQKLAHDFHFVHRLDFATSGAVCIALHKRAAKAAATAFETRKTKKYYVAIVRGHVAKELMDITDPIGEDKRERHGNHRMCLASDPNSCYPKFAHTRLLVLQRGLYGTYPATKVLLRPVTGRRHQLRVHCMSIGHTIVGDYTYSNKNDSLPTRMYLHSYRLVIPNDIESIDIQTADPFENENNPHTWMVVEALNDLDENVFKKLDTQD
ncbi:RNA pseudouridylate synthase domain-containing protein 1-like [Schistocerca cancellata]|uniref:RNA pseudouridylate synthase domain-containing protein 1-like n=1 Tax=Schistocerca cancellata TaxID=274614 RepID=UPI0021184FDC|nr:RNA pseudouridylate synthase domain-containing protein 1-like [Schistocerca cancellata]